MAQKTDKVLTPLEQLKQHIVDQTIGDFQDEPPCNEEDMVLMINNLTKGVGFIKQIHESQDTDDVVQALFDYGYDSEDVINILCSVISY